MPRPLRTVLPNTPHHIVQRGHNRQAVFVADEDYDYYRTNLVHFKKELGCLIYAYCLMTNHVHLIVNPLENPDSLSKLMKGVAGRQTRYVNKLEGRSGSLWEGRFKSSIISTSEYLPACCRYIDLNPLRAGMVTEPGEYKWSSYLCKAYGKTDPVVDFDKSYLSAGRNEKDRQAFYTQYVRDTIPDGELKLIREALQRGQLTGGERFRREVSEKLGIRISNNGPGRPKKVKK
jgi:putative transposase